QLQHSIAPHGQRLLRPGAGSSHAEHRRSSLPSPDDIAGPLVPVAAVPGLAAREGLEPVRHETLRERAVSPDARDLAGGQLEDAHLRAVPVDDDQVALDLHGFTMPGGSTSTKSMPPPDGAGGGSAGWGLK